MVQGLERRALLDVQAAYQEIVKDLTSARQRANLSQDRIAELLDLHASEVRDFESCNRTDISLFKILMISRLLLTSIDDSRGRSFNAASFAACVRQRPKRQPKP